MLRVFQLSETDPRLWNKKLKNFEVETMFQTYNQRLSLKTKKVQGQALGGEDNSRTVSESESDQATVNSEESVDEAEDLLVDSDIESLKDGEGNCPICLLDMVEGESLEQCSGCRNKLHHHCIAIWCRECIQQHGELLCPLCREKWSDETLAQLLGSDVQSPGPASNTGAGPNVLQAQIIENRVDHVTEPVPREYRETAQQWTQVLGDNIVSHLFSQNWSLRETALTQLTQIMTGVLMQGAGTGRYGAQVSVTTRTCFALMVDTCSAVLAHILADPVFRVFVAALKMLNTFLSYIPCRDEDQQSRLQTLLQPVLGALLLKCADSNRRTSLLSISAVKELAKGQGGDLALGKNLVNPGRIGLGDLPYVLSCIVQEFESQVHYQWLLGRMTILESFVHDSPELFQIHTVQASGAGPVLNHLSRSHIKHVLGFTKKALLYQHKKINKLAKRIFYQVARLHVHDLQVFTCFMDLLENTDNQVCLALHAKLDKLRTEHYATPHTPPMPLQAAAEGAHKVLVCVESDQSKPSSRSTSPVEADNRNPPCTYCGNRGPAAGSEHAPSRLPQRKRSSLTRKVPPAPSGSAAAASDQVAGGLCVCCKNKHMGILETPRRLSGQAGVKMRQFKTSRTHRRFPRRHHSDGFIMMSQIGPDADDEDEFDDGVQGDSVNRSDLKKLVKHSTPVKADSGHVMAEDIFRFAVEPVYDGRVGDERTADGQTVREESTSGEGKRKMGTSCIKESALNESISQASPSDNLCGTSASGDELSDTTFSPKTMHEQVSFRSAMADAEKRARSSDRTTPTFVRQTKNLEMTPHKDEEACHCKEEVELEEAKALIEALALSELPETAHPRVPGLCSSNENDTITIHVLQETADGTSEPFHQYQETVNWVRGPMIGTGAFSTCYQARDTKTGTLMCVKQIAFCRNSKEEQEKVCQAVREEVEMMANLRHRNVVRIIGATLQGCHFFMFVEWMPGGSVSKLLETYGAFEEPVITNYTFQVLLGLSYLHDNMILHRDLKGANLLMDSTGQRLRIADFGASARLASRQTGAGEFQGQLLGTVAFMAPEVLRGESYGRSCDVWSVGCAVIEMLTTKPPWGASAVSNHLALIYKIASTTTPPPIPDGVSPAIKDFLLRCLEVSSEERPPCKELLRHPLFRKHPRVQST